jgi:maleate cis-trans isomerase
MASIDAIDALEADLGIPVISSNQAQLWTTLRAAGVFARISGWGRLLAK